MRPKSVVMMGKQVVKAKRVSQTPNYLIEHRNAAVP